MKKEREKLEGLIFNSKRYGEFKVLDYLGNSYYNIEFILTKTKKVSQATSIKKGSIMDEFFPSIFKIGYLGNEFNTTHFLYNRWYDMISRCYNIKDKSYKTYGKDGILVHNSWHNFSNFVKDSVSLKNYDEMLIKNGTLQIDKDIINRDAKIYSSETCMWATKNENIKEMNKRVKQKYFIATRLNDDYIEEHYNIYEFCLKHNLPHYMSVINCLKGKRNDYMGWKFEYKDNANIYFHNNTSKNKSGYKGVSFRKDRNKWRATCRENNKNKLIGAFDDIKDAIIARYEWEIKIYGKFRKVDAKDIYLKNINYI